jgi:hypothetical protein
MVLCLHVHERVGDGAGLASSTLGARSECATIGGGELNALASAFIRCTAINDGSLLWGNR